MLVRRDTAKTATASGSVRRRMDSTQGASPPDQMRTRSPGGGAYQAGEAGAHRTIVGQGAGVPGPGEDLRLFNGPLRSLGPLFGSGRRGGKQLGDEGGGVVFPVVAGA